jgi:hypothetical protein
MHDAGYDVGQVAPALSYAYHENMPTLRVLTIEETRYFSPNRFSSRCRVRTTDAQVSNYASSRRKSSRACSRHLAREIAELCPTSDMGHGRTVTSSLREVPSARVVSVSGTING